ncbi:Metallo-dependent phosphatase, partial [Fomitiporia mediterranea MF3/22]|uniref:Metallo-dependent phosphatase n=1 Tax=Fomitiporia mediterranea (strain MF3/22) TaxID=694068 RepID=UPI0004407C70
MHPVRKARRTLSLHAIVQKASFLSAADVLRITWIAAVAWYELGIFFWSVGRCQWPDKAFVYDSAVGTKSEPASQLAHGLLVADPQVLDLHSYPERGRILGLLSQVVVDLNMRKGWWAVKRLLLRENDEVDKHDAIVFLGDMMDNGRNAYSDTEYLDYYKRFRSIFSTDSFTKLYYIPGNHDVGLGTSRSFSPRTRSRYVKHFGRLNYKVSLANHTFVMLDAPGLVEEDYRRASANQRFEDWTPPPGGVIDFVNKFSSVGSDEPVILFSHIPLFRPDTASCGPLRERGTIRRGVGFGYQNTLGRHTSDFILKNIRPNAIFSGDDHDYCEYTHSVPLVSEGPEPKIEYVREVTVKSFSMAMGIRNPGFQLLSLVDPTSLIPGSPSHADAPCILPDQLAIYLGRYLPLLFVTLCVLGISTLRRVRSHGGWSAYTLEIDSTDSSSVQMSPESTFGGPFSATRMPHSAGLRSSDYNNTAPTYRAFSATFPSTPYTPDFNVTSNSRVATPGLLSAPPAGLAAFPAGDIENGHGSSTRDEYDNEFDEEAQFAGRRMHNNSYLTPSVNLSAPYRRRLAWTRTFVLRGRRRRITIGVPPLLEQALIKLYRALRYRRLGRVASPRWTGRGRKGGYYTRSGGHESAMRIFLDGMLAAAWPPLLVFVLINYYMFL